MKQEKAVTVLKNLVDACQLWSQIHTDQSDGGSVGKRKVFIDKMGRKDGLVAEEAKILLRDKVLTQQVDVNEKIFPVEGSDEKFNNVFNSIGTQFTGKYGNESKHKKIAAYVYVNCPYVPMTGAKVSLFYEYVMHKIKVSWMIFRKNPLRIICVQGSIMRINSELG